MLCCREVFLGLLGSLHGSTTTAAACVDTSAIACADLNPICGNDLREGRGRSRTLKLSVNSRDDASATSCSSTRSPSRLSSPGQYGRGAKRSTDASKVDKIQPMSKNKPQTKNQGHFKIVGLGTSTAKPLTEKKKPKGTKGKSRCSQNRTKKEGHSSSPFSTQSRYTSPGKGKKKNARPERDLPPAKPSTEKKKFEGTKGKSRGSQNRTKKEGRSSSPFSTRSRCTLSAKEKKKIARPERDLPPTTNISHLVEVDNNPRRGRRGRTPSREAPGARCRSRERTMPTRQFSQRGNDFESIPTNTGKVKKEPSSRRWGFGSRGSLRVDQET
jgi:hypothetical protein